MGAQRSNLTPNFFKMEDYQRQNSPKSAKVARKFRSATSQFSGGYSWAATCAVLLMRVSSRSKLN